MSCFVDPTSNILGCNCSLDTLFFAKTIAIIGASSKKGRIGNVLMKNLSTFKGDIYPINPKSKKIRGLKVYKSIKDVPKKVDLVVIATPAKTVPDIVKECVDAKVCSIVIISAGFKELGAKGIALETKIKKHIENTPVRIIGPNCLGIMNPKNNLNATFADQMASNGNIAFISQSGALCTAILDWSKKEGVGFSSFISIGSMIDVNWGDLIDYFRDDPATKSILIYMESIGNVRSFLSAAKAAALLKPIILIKAGRTKESAKAAASHTGALSGSDEVFDAALERIGVLRVDSIEDLFAMTDVFSKQKKPKGPNLAIVTNAGGPGVIATDALIKRGGSLAVLENKTIKELNAVLPEFWSHNNPIDILGDGDADRYEKTLSIVEKDKNVDGILVILTPQHMTKPKQVAEKLKKFSNIKKPIFASFMGGEKIEDAKDILIKANIPTFLYPDLACRAFAYMYQYSKNLEEIYHIPELRDTYPDKEKELEKHKKVASIIQKAKKEKKHLLDEYESKQILEAYDIKTSETYVATSKEEAYLYAKKIKFPVVLKLFSKTITHKTDVGGVKLNLTSFKEVEKAFLDIKKSVNKKDFQGVTVQPMILDKGYELILGSSIDKDFGPVLLFGTGGELVEVFKDSSLAIPPLNSNLALKMMQKTKIYKALLGVRGKKGVDLDLLETILIRFSNLVSEYPSIKEIDINPLLVSEKRIIALDARVILNGDDKSILAVRPYPAEYVKFIKIKSTKAIVRPIRPEDEKEIVNFLKTLSKKSILHRFLKELNYTELVAKKRLTRICFADYEKEIAIVCEINKKIVAVARLTRIGSTKNARFTIVVKDSHQKMGIGSVLLKHLLNIAKKEGVKNIQSKMLKKSIFMQKMCKKLGFSLKEEKNDIVRVCISL